MSGSRQFRWSQTVGSSTSAKQPRSWAHRSLLNAQNSLLRGSSRAQASSYASESGQGSCKTIEKKYTWKTGLGDFDIAYEAYDFGHQESILLVHGFGASKGHYRKIFDKFPGFNVYAIDLLGFGESSKPLIPYNMKIYRDQIKYFIEYLGAEDFQELSNNQSGSWHIVGNSIGSLAALMAAADNPSVKSLILLNCAGGLNNKAIQEDWRVKLAMPLFLLIDALLKNETIGTYLFNKVRDKENLRKILVQTYPKNPSAVDDELVEILHAPSNHPNAKDVFVEIITTNSAGPSPLEILPNIACPMLLLWGTADNLTPSDGPIGKFFQNINQVRDDSKFIHLEGVGHCPMDEVPDDVVKEIELWLAKLQPKI
jgi:pimeloyl-ACP methyl ester carboxylesterase